MTNKNLDPQSSHHADQARMEVLQKKLQFLEHKNQELKDRILTLSYENRDQLQLIKQLLEQTPFGIAIFDQHYKLLRLNKAAEGILGLERVKAIGNQCSEIFDCYRPDVNCPVIEKGENYDREETLCTTARKANTPLLRSTTVITNRNEKLIIESFIDISDIKKAQQTKNDFMAKISHELRTPLNAIIGYSELLSEDLRSQLNDEQSVFLNSIHKAGDDMLELVERLLDFNQLMSGIAKPNISEFELVPLLEEIATQIKPELEKNSNELEFRYHDPLPNMRSDKIRIRQILVNLLLNASKFSQHNTIKTIITSNPSSKRIRIDIVDHGVGMTEEQKQRIFNAFEQADNSRTRNYDGVGLGLTLSKQSAILLGGNITVESIPEWGSTFTLTLPMSIA